MLSEKLKIDLLRRAYRVAAEQSQDPRTQNGAIIVEVLPDSEANGCTIMASAANSILPQVDFKPERLSSELKPYYVEHAERRVLQVFGGWVLKPNFVLVCPWFACAACARAIIAAGIRRVLGHDAPFHKTRKDWQPDIDHGDIMLKEAGVQFERLNAKIGDCSILFNGELVHP